MPLAFAGEVMEADDLYVLGSRVYSARLRRFLTPDGASPFDEGGMNRYAYCAGDPVNRIDPSGNVWWDWLAAAAGLVGAAIGAIVTGGALAGAAGAAIPSLIMLGASGGLEVVSALASVGSITALALDDHLMTQVLGWTAAVTGLMSAGVSLVATAAPRALRGGYLSSIGPKGHALSTPRAPGAHELLAQHIRTPARFKLDDVALAPMESTPWRQPGSTLPNHIHRFERGVGREKVVHFAWDKAPSNAERAAAFMQITRELPADAKMVWVSGTRGSPSGQNWFGGFRDSSLKTNMYRADRRSHWVGERGQRVSVQDYSSIAAERAMAQWNTPGVHFYHPYRFGAADELLRTQFNVSYTPAVFY